MKKLDISKCTVGPVRTNCYFARNKETGEGFVVDPGDEKDRLLARIRSLDMECKGILLTHGHFDHIMAVNPLSRELQVPVFAFEAEKEMLENPALSMTDAYAPCTVRADRFLTDGEEFTLADIPLKVLHTPGHTPGSCCYYAPEEEILFSGDTLFCLSVGRTDFPGGSMTQMRDSLHRLLSVLPQEVVVLPGHDQPTTIGQEMRYNPFV